MQLSVYKRDKNQTKKLRMFDNVPAVIYAKGIENENIYIKKDELKKCFASLKPGDLPTTVFTLKGERETFKAIVKDIQYFVTTYEVQHIDFLKIDEKASISVNVPIKCIGVNECKGVKLGGNFRQIIRSLRVKCLPKHLPKEFVIDITEMGVPDVKRLSDIELPKDVVSTNKNLGEVIVSISKR
jgi:large subunit ribosomal protein L25